MQYFNVTDAAQHLQMRPEGVLALCQSGWFGRKVSNTWLITDLEISGYFAGKRFPPNDLPPLYDSDAVIKDLKISRSRFYRLVAQKKLEGLRFGRRGGTPNLVFTEEQLEAARTAVIGIDGTGQRHVPVDKHIEEREDGRFYILGTLSNDPDGQERNYKSRTIARAKARAAFGQPPIYKKGETLKRDGRTFITFLKDVTPIDGLADIQLGNVRVLWSVKKIISFEDQANQENELVTIYRDKLWPEGENNGTDKQDSAE